MNDKRVADSSIAGDRFCALKNIFGAIIDDLVGAQLEDILLVRRGTGTNHEGLRRFRQLNGEAANTPRSRVHKDNVPLTNMKATVKRRISS